MSIENKAKPQVYEAFRERAELLTEAQAHGPEALVKVLKMLHVAGMAAARRANKIAGEVLADLAPQSLRQPNRTF